MRSPLAIGIVALLAGCAGEDDPIQGPGPGDPAIAAYCPEWFPPDLGREGVDLRTRADGTWEVEVVGEGLELTGLTTAVEIEGDWFFDGEEIPGLGTFHAEWRHVGTSSLVEIRSWIEGDEVAPLPVRYHPVVTTAGGGLRGLSAPLAMGSGGLDDGLAVPLLPTGPPIVRRDEQLVGDAGGGVYLGPAGVLAGSLIIEVSRDHGDRISLQVAEEGLADRPASPVLVGLGVDPAQVLARAAVYAGYRASAEVCRAPPAGWSSGPAYGWPSNPAVLEDGQAAVQGELGYLGLDLGLAAGGWYDTLGEWGPGPAYPAGLDAVSTVWGTRGGTLGLWLAPFWVADEAALYGDAPEALLRDGAGDPVPCGLASSGDTCALVDATHPDGRHHLATLGARLWQEHGAAAVWLDQLGDAAGDGEHHDPAAGGVDCLRAGLAALREAAPEVQLVAVGVPPWWVAGLADAVQPGPLDPGAAFLDCLAAEADTAGPRPAACDDASSDLTPLDAAAAAGWDDVRDRAARLAVSAHWNDTLAALDLGPLVVAGLTPDEARTAATLTALAGGTYLLGDRLDGLDPEVRAIAASPMLQELRRTPGAVVPDDRFEQPLALPSRWRRELPGSEAAVAVVNWGDEEAVIEVPLEDRSPREDLWDPAWTWSGTDEGFAVAVPAHGVRLIRIR